MKYSLGSSNFLEEISSFSHSIAFLYFFALIADFFYWFLSIFSHWSDFFYCQQYFIGQFTYPSPCLPAMFPIRRIYWSGSAIPCHQDSHWRFWYLSITILTLIRLTLNTRRKSPFSSAQILSSGLLLSYTGNETRYLFLAPADALHVVDSDLSLLLSACLFVPTIIQLTSPEEFAFFLPFLWMLASFVLPRIATGCCCCRCHALFNWLLPVCIFYAVINIFSDCFGTGSICLNLFWWKNLPGARTLGWTQATLFFQLFERDRDTTGTLNNMKIVKSIEELALWYSSMSSFCSALFPVPWNPSGISLQIPEPLLSISQSAL